MSMYRTRYFVTFPDQPELEVSLADWCRAERAAGFHGPEGHAATGGFSGYGISGRITYGLEGEPETVQAPAGAPELELEGKAPGDGWDELQDAIDLASDQDTVTWLTRDGRRVAAIVPVDVAGDHERRIAEVLPVIRHHRQPHGEITELLIPREHLSPEDPPGKRLEQFAAARAEVLRHWPFIRHEFPRGHLSLFSGQVQLLPGQPRPYELDPARLRELLPDVPIDRNIAPGHELMRQILREAGEPMTTRQLVIALAERGVTASRGDVYDWLQADTAAGLVKSRGREEDGQPVWRYTWKGEQSS